MAIEVCRPVHGCSFGDDAVPRPDRRRGLGPALPPRRRRDQLQEPRLRHRRGPGEQHPQAAGGARGASRPPVAAGCCSRAASSRGARAPARRACPTSPPMASPRPSPPRSSASNAPRRHRAGQVRHPQPVRALRGAAVHRLPDEELAGRRHAQLLQPRLRPGQHPRVAPGRGLRPLRRRGAGRGLRPDSIPADTPRARAPSRSAWPRRCAPGWGSPAPSS